MHVVRHVTTMHEEEEEEEERLYLILLHCANIIINDIQLDS